MTEIKTGGPAYPQDEMMDSAHSEIHRQHEGMTLLDYFAGQALVGLIANPESTEHSPQEMADAAYGLASLMIETRPGGKS